MTPDKITENNNDAKKLITGRLNMFTKAMAVNNDYTDLPRIEELNFILLCLSDDFKLNQEIQNLYD